MPRGSILWMHWLANETQNLSYRFGHCRVAALRVRQRRSHRLKDPSVATTYGAGDSAKNAPADAIVLGQKRSVQDRMQDTWWTGFGDERLDRMVARVLEVNTDLASGGFSAAESSLQCRPCDE